MTVGRYACAVGRVGLLAVALGVGATGSDGNPGLDG